MSSRSAGITTHCKDRLMFLDGLRGWASIVVVLSHTLQVWLLNPQGMTERGLEVLLSIVNLTPLGVMMDGSLSVYLFFAISGMALTYPVLRSTNSFSTLVKMTVVRYPRLAIPVFFSCLIAYAIASFGLWQNVLAGQASHSSWLQSFYRFEDTGFLSMLRFSLWDVFFSYDVRHSWNAVLWTMPIELIGSMALFLLLAVPWRPMRVILGLCLAASSLQGPYFGFFAGYLLTETILMTGRGIGTRASWLRSGFGLAILLVALMAAVLARSSVILGFETGHLGSVIGKNLIATALLSGLILFRPTQVALETNLSLFVGRISFSLYLVHLPIICTVSSWLYLSLYEVLPFSATVLTVVAVTFVVSVPAAHFFERAIEMHVLGQAKSALVEYVEQALTAARQRAKNF